MRIALECELHPSAVMPPASKDGTVQAIIQIRDGSWIVIIEADDVYRAYMGFRGHFGLTPVTRVPAGTLSEVLAGIAPLMTKE